MEIEVFDGDWVTTAKQKDVFLSIRGEVFNTKGEAERDSTVCMAVVLYHLGNEESFTRDGLFVKGTLDIMGYEELKDLFDANLLTAEFHIQERYAEATRTDLDRVRQIMEAIRSDLDRVRQII
jgi:hypothetical protein